MPPIENPPVEDQEKEQIQAPKQMDPIEDDAIAILDEHPKTTKEPRHSQCKHHRSEEREV